MQHTTGEAVVLQIFENIRRAMLANDSETLQRYVAENFCGSDAGGRPHGREEYLVAYGPGGVALDEFEVSGVETRSWADTVLVTGTTLIRGTYQDQEFEHRARFLDVYRFQNDAWQLVASSVTDIA
jgi:hypothetical protein